MGENPLAPYFARVISNRYSDGDLEAVVELLLGALQDSDLARVERFFMLIVKLKRNEANPHRNAYAYFAYSHYLADNGREPSKAELKAYMLADGNGRYRDLPAPEDKKGWTRLWKNAGLSRLALR